MVNIFRSLGRIAGQAARAIKPKRLHGPKHGAKHFFKKHGMKAAILTGGVALGAGSDAVIEAVRGRPEEPPLIMQGGQLAENRINDDSWNFLRFDTNNENFAEEEKIIELQTMEIVPNMAAHSDDLAHVHAHVSGGGHHHGDSDFIARMKAAFLLLIIVFLICFLLKVGRMVGKMMRTCYNKRRTRLELRELPRLEVVHDGWQRQVQRIPHADPSPTNSSCPSYGTAVATAPTTGQAFYEEMTAAQAAMKLAKTLAVNPVPRPHPSSSNGIPDMETVLQNLEENIQSNLQDAARPPQAQVPPQQDTAQTPTA